jgi:hypothetical protein
MSWLNRGLMVPFAAPRDHGYSLDQPGPAAAIEPALAPTSDRAYRVPLLELSPPRS